MHKYLHISFIQRFFLTWVLFFLKTLKGFSHKTEKKKIKLECLFIFSGGNCTLNLRSFKKKISQVIGFLFFFNFFFWLRNCVDLQVFKRLWQASSHTVPNLHFLSKNSIFGKNLHISEFDFLNLIWRPILNLGCQKIQELRIFCPENGQNWYFSMFCKFKFGSKI